MNDDYLWDGSGEPDPEIAQLENLLGEFRQKEPLPQLPLASHPFNAFKFLALAATIILAFAISLSLYKKSVPMKENSTTKWNAPLLSHSQTELKHEEFSTKDSNNPELEISSLKKTNRSYPSSKRVAAKLPQGEKAVLMPAVSEEEGEKATAQLILALQIASSKLNLAQRQVQSQE